MLLPESLRDELTADLSGTVSEPQLAAILGLIRPAIRSDPASTGHPDLGSSKLGGSPDVPPSWEWPTHNTSPLCFLAQFRMADLRGLIDADLLPRDGLLSFFFGECAYPTPFSPSCRDELSVARVYHFGDRDLHQAVLPDSMSDQARCWNLLFKQIWEMPEDPFHYATHDLYQGLASVDRDSLIEILVENGPASGPVKLLGYPSRGQEGCLQLSCECLHRQVPMPDSPSEELRGAAVAWELLAQFSMSDRRVWPFGSDGYLCFWIRESDLARCDFSQVCFTFERT